jgi:hypothetical protein
MLKEDKVASNLVNDSDDRLVNLTFGNKSTEKEWAPFRDVANSSSLENLGPPP